MKPLFYTIVTGILSMTSFASAQSADRPPQPSPDAVWVDPVCKTVQYFISVPAETGDTTQDVWIPGCWKEYPGTAYIPPRPVPGGHGMYPGHTETRMGRVFVEGHYEKADGQGVIAAHTKAVDRKVTISPGHWEVPTPNRDQ